MSNPWPGRLKRYALNGVLPGTAIGAGLCLRMVHEARDATYTDWFGGGALGGMMILFFWPLFAVIGVALAWSNGLPGNKAERVSIQMVCYVLVFGLVLSGGLLGFRQSDVVRAKVWTEFTHAAKPLVEAIARHQEDTGTLPGKVEDLVPRWLDRVPRPPGGRPIELIQKPDDEFGQPWRIRIDAGKTPGSFGDWFVFHPTGDYPQSGYGGLLVRMGDWGYYCE